MKWQEFDTTGLENVYTQYTYILLQKRWVHLGKKESFFENYEVIKNGRGLSYPIKPEIKIFTDQVLRVRQDSAREN